MKLMTCLIAFQLFILFYLARDSAGTRPVLAHDLSCSISAAKSCRAVYWQPIASLIPFVL
jgi:hypothetical protein